MCIRDSREATRKMYQNLVIEGVMESLTVIHVSQWIQSVSYTHLDVYKRQELFKLVGVKI